MIDAESAKLSIAENVRRLMELRGLSQSALARLTGDNPMYISRIIRAVCEPSSSGLARLAEALGVSTDELLYGPMERIPTSQKKLQNAG